MIQVTTAFIVVSSIRFFIAITGLIIMETFKWLNGVRRHNEQKKAGLPVGQGMWTWLRILYNASFFSSLYTLAFAPPLFLFDIAKLVVKEPKKQGIWILGHVTCMASSFLGSVYMFINIILATEYQTDYTSLPTWQGVAYFVRDYGTLLVIPLALIQILLVVTGFYGTHRWHGRFIVHVWTLSSIATIVLQVQSSIAFWILLSLLGVELLGFFSYKIYHESRISLYVDSPKVLSPTVIMAEPEETDTS